MSYCFVRPYYKKRHIPKQGVIPWHPLSFLIDDNYADLHMIKTGWRPLQSSNLRLEGMGFV